MKIAKGVVYFLLILWPLKSPAQQVAYPTIGFGAITTHDSSRLYKPNAPTSDPLHFRPIEMDLWYPAEANSTDTTAKFYDLVHLLEKRSASFGDTNEYKGLSDELIQYICAGFDCPDHETLKKVNTKSYPNAKPVAGKFPLVVYLAAFNGMSYENYQLFEALVHQGFIVVSISSIGRYPGNMSLDSADLFEQVNDAIFCIDYLTSKGFVTQNHSLVGYSWGGLAACIMSMTRPFEYKAVVSLDGSEQFNYSNEEDNKSLTQIRNAVYFEPQKIKTPYLYLDRDFTGQDSVPDSVYSVTDHISNSHYLKIIGASHEDFSCLSNISRKDSTNARYKLIQELIISFLLDNAKGSTGFENLASTLKVSKTFSPHKVNASNSGKIIGGIVRDSKSNSALPYVNIGVPDKGIGTATDINGKFSLTLPASSADDTLKFSMVGYEDQILDLHNWPSFEKSSLDIHLKEKANELKEVVVVDSRLTTRVLGNKTQSKFFGGKFSSNDLGSELAIHIKIKKALTYLESFYVNISYNTSDSATFRLNIYDVNNGFPGRNILTENILFRIGRQSGKIEFDLSNYNIIVKDDFFVSLEWIDGNRNSGIVFSAGFTNKNTFYRKVSQGKWKKYQLGVGFNVKVRY